MNTESDAMNEAISTTRSVNADEPILEIENLSISFFTRAGEIPAVMDFSCRVMPGEAMGIVGESGCGKSTVALGIMRDLSNVEELRQIRGNEIAMIYQEPMASLNPAMKIGKQLMEVPIIHDRVSKDEAWNRALEMVEAVRLPDPERIMRSFPHQLSGGQQQGARQEIRYVDDLRVAQSGPDPGNLRPRHRHVFRRGGGNGPCRGCLRPHEAPLYTGPVPLDPVARRRQERPAADRHPRPVAAAA